MESIETKLINGRDIADKIYQTFPQRLGALGYTPVLADIVVGDDPVSLSYVNIKGKTAKKHGLDFKMVQLPATATLAEIQQAIVSTQNEPRMSGVIVQLPLPAGIPTDEALSVLDPAVDVDCIGPKMNQLFYVGEAPWEPPTAGAIWEIIKKLPVDFHNKKVAVVGQGELVGKPITFLLRQRACQVVTATQEDKDLRPILQGANLIISGTGQGGLITGDLVSTGAAIIDAGTSESGAGIVGDVDQDSVTGVASWLSPVPGGVGPVTVAKLLSNVIAAAQRRREK